MLTRGRRTGLVMGFGGVRRSFSWGGRMVWEWVLLVLGGISRVENSVTMALSGVGEWVLMALSGVGEWVLMAVSGVGDISWVKKCVSMDLSGVGGISRVENGVTMALSGVGEWMLMALSGVGDIPAGVLTGLLPTTATTPESPWMRPSMLMRGTGVIWACFFFFFGDSVMQMASKLHHSVSYLWICESSSLRRILYPVASVVIV